MIAINYNKIYELQVMETKPDKAVSITECNMNVEFDAPLGYKEPESMRSQLKAKLTTVFMPESWASLPSPALGTD